MKTVKFLILSVFVINIIYKSPAQTTKEQWKGQLIVDLNGTETKVLFSIDIIKEGDEEKCRGENTLWLEINKQSYFARHSFEGTYNEEGVLDFFDTAVIESTSPNSSYFYWCEKKGKLFADGNKMTGEILSHSPKGDCLPAWASLERME